MGLIVLTTSARNVLHKRVGCALLLSTIHRSLCRGISRLTSAYPMFTNLHTRCGSQKCENSKFFPFFSYTYILFILSPNLSQKSHQTAWELDSTEKFTLGHHGGITGTHLDQQLRHNGQHITRISPIITCQQFQLQPSSYRHPQYSTTPHLHTAISLSLLHITSYLQPELVYFPCMTAAAYTTTLTCKHIRT
jgi:hypothetical protein